MSTGSKNEQSDDLSVPKSQANGSLPVPPASAATVKPEPPASSIAHSMTIGTLIAALCEASKDFPEITKDTENPYFKSQYADLATLIKATRPHLAKNGLSVLQLPQTRGAIVILTTLLAHTSGEWLSNELEMPISKIDAQGVGSGITYARRYSYQSILNIAGEEDDDGNAAVGKTQADRWGKGSTDSTPGKVNPVQIRAFWSACTTGKKSKEQALQYFGNMGYESVDELNKSELDAAIKWALN